MNAAAPLTPPGDVTPDRHVVDSHAHLLPRVYGAALEAVLDECRRLLGHVVVVGAGYGSAGAAEAVALAARHPDLLSAIVGVHPHEAGTFSPAVAAELEAWLQRGAAVALGEIGLDYHYDLSPRPVQRQAFEAQLAIARRLGVPVVLHIREAWPDALAILDATGVPAAGGVVHCFTAGPAEAQAALERGLDIAVGGVVTFPRSDEVREAVQLVPVERLLIETDSPYLTPVPHRAVRPNRPAFVAHVGRAVAALKGLSPADVARITGRNARVRLRLPAAPADTTAPLAYPIRDSLYLSVTNRCTLACTFCPKRHGQYVVRGHELRLPAEPSGADLLAAVGDPRPWREIVFCGLGESLLRPDVVVEVARALRARGARRIRIDTDGLANLVHGRDVLAELAGHIDALSVSLNAADAATYARLCPSRFGPRAFAAVCDFLRAAPTHIPDVTASVVAVPGLDLAACEALARELGVRLRVRPYDDVG